MIYLATLVVAVVAAELLLRLPWQRQLGDLALHARKAARVLLSHRISDTWKERVLLYYARRMLAASLGLAAVLLAVAVAVTGIPWLVDQLTGGEGRAVAFLWSVDGLLLVTVAALLHVLARKRLERV